MWCIGKITGQHIAQTEDILDLYELEVPDNVAVVCFDERPCVLQNDVYTSLPMKPGKIKKIDFEYQRKGTANLLLAYDIHSGKRFGQVRKQRTKFDFAQFMDWLEQRYPNKDRIIAVLDNLNTHNYGSFYENLSIERASQLRQKIRFQFTPKHASWLNMVELEFAALSKQCLNRRIGTIALLENEIMAWIKERNKSRIKIKWSYTTEKARQNLSKHYIKIYNNN